MEAEPAKPGGRKRKAGPTTVARAYGAALDAHDLDAAAALWKPGGIDRIAGIAEFAAPEGLKRWFGELFAAFPDARLEVLSVTAQKQHAAVRYRIHGTFDGTGRFQGLTPNGARVDIEGLDLLTVVDGLIAENHAYINGAELARQLGALPAPGSLAERGVTAALNARVAAGELVSSLRERAGTARSPRA